MKRAYLDKLSEFPQLYQSFPQVVPKWIMMKLAPLDKLRELPDKPTKSSWVAKYVCIAQEFSNYLLVRQKMKPEKFHSFATSSVCVLVCCLFAC